MTPDEVEQLDENIMDIISGAQKGFVPVIGGHYHLYKRKDGTHFISLVAPEEWNIEKQPNAFDSFVATLESITDNKWRVV